MSEDATKLTNEDREALISLLIDEYGGERADWVELGSLRRLGARVEAIAARHVKAALNEAADEIESDPGVRLGHNISVVCSCLRCEVAHAAARIVRTAANNSGP